MDRFSRAALSRAALGRTTLGLVGTALLISPLAISSALAQPKESVQTDAGALSIEPVVDGLVQPWGMALSARWPPAGDRTRRSVA